MLNVTLFVSKILDVVEIFYHLRNIISQEIHVEGPLDKINPDWPGCQLKGKNYAGPGKY